ncbi:MAG TPA: hypothetical protein VK395_01005 [Gemmataceae bacterium]|nr:hypothetical protein [Gemmataceae bacterium]
MSQDPSPSATLPRDIQDAHDLANAILKQVETLVIHAHLPKGETMKEAEADWWSPLSSW